MMVFIESAMNYSPDNRFLKDFQVFQKFISHYGMYNSLSQTLLKITFPGVPDFYQGTEIWDFSLVDPDNRRPVNYGVRSQMLEELKRYETKTTLPEIMRELTTNKEDGRIKLYLTYKALNFRRKNRELFDKGEYISLDVIGERSDNVCTFARRLGSKIAIVVVQRFLTKLIPHADILPFGTEAWKDSFITIPFAEEGKKYLNIFTGEMVTVKNNDGAMALYLSEVFVNSSIALMEGINN